jgi:hypothetical protein
LPVNQGIPNRLGFDLNIVLVSREFLKRLNLSAKRIRGIAIPSLHKLCGRIAVIRVFLGVNIIELVAKIVMPLNLVLSTVATSLSSA